MAIEILAPAGGPAQLTAAVRSGADAVYLGTQSFNARRNAENFSAQTLKEAVSYCHGRGVKVHAAVNTLVKDSELSSLYKEIELLAQSGVDAVIVQSLAAASMFRRYCPSMPLHASTQMTIHNLAGVLAAQELGFSRVVLARELTLEEIRAICKHSPIEIEVFVHGALCMSVSGQCYLSSILGERSGNRGVCAQPCRLNFQSGEREYALSLKDMSHISKISALAEAGVSSLKIEGRMKRPEYVSAAVLACREALSGQVPDLTNLRAVFSRSGFTDGYLTGKRDLTMFGHRTKEDVTAADGVLGLLASGYRKELSRVPADMHLKLAAGEPARLDVTDGSISVCAVGDVPEVARVKPTDLELARESMSKTGGTPFLLRTLTADIGDGLLLPRGKLNAMRKDALESLLAARSEIKPKQVAGPYTQPAPGKSRSAPQLRVRLESKAQLFDGVDGVAWLYMPVEEIDAELTQRFGARLIGELPRLTFPMQEKSLMQRLGKLKELGISHVCAGNIGLVSLAKQAGLVVHGAFGLNILDSESLLEYEKMGLADTMLSFEINLRDAKALRGEKPRGILGYGHLPLMLFRTCPGQGGDGCSSCDGRPTLTDRTGMSFELACSRWGYSTLHNPIPLYLGDKEVQGVDFSVLYFTTEDHATCKSIWEAYGCGAPLDGKLTRGLYYRKLL